jgi:hypothetical protein
VGERVGDYVVQHDFPPWSTAYHVWSTALAGAYQILIFTAGRQLGAPTTAIYPEPRPNDGHPSASDLATNATDGVRRVAAAASRAVAAALGEGVAHGRQREEL